MWELMGNLIFRYVQLFVEFNINTVYLIIEYGVDTYSTAYPYSRGENTGSISLVQTPSIMVMAELANPGKLVY